MADSPTLSDITMPSHATWESGVLTYSLCNSSDSAVTIWVCERPYLVGEPDGKIWKDRVCKEVTIPAKSKTTGKDGCLQFTYKCEKKPDRTYTDWYRDKATADADTKAGTSGQRAMGWATPVDPKEKEPNKMIAPPAPLTLGRFLDGISAPVGPCVIRQSQMNREFLYQFPTPYPMRLLHHWGSRPCEFIIEPITGAPEGWTVEAVYPRTGTPFKVEPGNTSRQGVLKITRPLNAIFGDSATFRVVQRVYGNSDPSPLFGFKTDVWIILDIVDSESRETLDTLGANLASVQSSPGFMPGYPVLNRATFSSPVGAIRPTFDRTDRTGNSRCPSCE